jgi:hypothetical protein
MEGSMDLVELTTDPGAAASERTAGPPDLASLSQVCLNEAHTKLLQLALPAAGGADVCRTRLHAEARDILALSQIAPPKRLQIEWLDVADDGLRALLFMQVPVAQHPDGQNRLRIARLAVLGLMYPRDAIRCSLPGTAFFEILQPLDVWHPNAAPTGQIPTSRLCLGPALLAGIRCVDLILMAYGALSMQAVQLNEQDPAGVLNAAAARWWQQNLEHIPLTATPFLAPGPNASAREPDPRRARTATPDERE